jgi:hypothetical protein
MDCMVYFNNSLHKSTDAIFLSRNKQRDRTSGFADTSGQVCIRAANDARPLGTRRSLRDDQWLHLNRQRTQTVAECLIGKAPTLNCNLAFTAFQAQPPN